MKDLSVSMKVDNIYNNLLEKINEKLSDEILLTTANDTQYLSEIMTDLPHDAYINKGATGCGGTTLAITNDQQYIIAVHSINTIKNKVNQHSNLCPVYGDITNEEILSYIDDKTISVKKFIVTYDSLPRLMEYINTEDYRLLVDEVQVLIRYLGHFKIATSHSLINQTYKFKSTSYLTATPTERCYLPTPLKRLEYVEIKWPNLIKPEIKHLYCGKQLQTKVVSFIIDKLDTTDDEIYVFYNSKIGVSTTIKKLLTIRTDLTIDDIKIIFADSIENKQYFRNQLKCKTLNLDNDLKTDENGLPLPGHNKRINFISSFGFEGVDFYTHGKNVISLIVADSYSKSMRYDISIDLPQIIGRFRRDKITNLFPENDIYFIWKSVSEEVKYTDHDALVKHISKNIYFCNSMLDLSSALFDESELYENNQRTMHNWEPYIIRDTAQSEIYLMNEYAMEGVMSVYCSMNVDYHMLGNLDENGILSDSSFIENSLQKISSKLDTFEVPQLSAQHSLLLNRIVRFAKIAKEYYKLHEMISHPAYSSKILDIKSEMQELLEMSDLLKDCLEHWTIDYVKAYNFREQYFTELLNNKMNIKNIKRDIEKYGLTVGSLIKYDDIIPLLEKIYKDNNITAKPKRTLLKEWFVMDEYMKNGVKYYVIMGDR